MAITRERLAEGRRIFKEEMALRDFALDALNEYNAGKCKNEELWKKYLELEARANEKEKEYKELIKG
jgi:hypothetical protein